MNQTVFLVVENGAPSCGFLTWADANRFADERRLRFSKSAISVQGVPVYGERDLDNRYDAADDPHAWMRY